MNKKEERRVVWVDKINKNAVATMHNKFIEARYKLTLEEQRIFLSLVSLIQPDDEDFKDYKISVKAIAELIGTKHKNMYRVLDEATDRLMQRIIKIEAIDENDKKVFKKFAFISYAEYKEGEGYLIVSIDKHLKPYLLQLKEQFSKVPLKYLFRLRSTYAVRLYELLKQYENTGYRVDYLPDLREMLGVEKNEYKRFEAFDRRVLKKAVEEINEKTDLEVSYSKKKTGRKITHIEFAIFSKNVDETEDTQTENNYSESIDIQAQKSNDLWEDTLHILLTVYDADEEEIQFLKDYAIAHYKTDTRPKEMIIDTIIVPELKEDRKMFLDLLFKYLSKIKSIVKTETNSNYDVKISEELIKSVQ